jgi:hypothetical protein
VVRANTTVKRIAAGVEGQNVHSVCTRSARAEEVSLILDALCMATYQRNSQAF